MRLLLLFLFIANAPCASAQLPLLLPAILSDHAVLQQKAEVRVWGWGPGSSKVKIVCSWNRSDTIFANIGPDCDWEAILKTPEAGGPHSISFICEKQKISINDLLLGEVWLCSGQSNMEFNLKWGVTDAGDVLKTCRNNQIRFFQVKQSYDKFPQTKCEGKWQICDENSMPQFSAVGYFFGRRLNNELKIPVGLIGSYWGGTCIQSWMPFEIFKQKPELQKFTKNIEPWVGAPKGADLLFNSMIYPISLYRIAGTIWYQGEANVANESGDYGKLFDGLIGSWRETFKNNFPFYYVQIAPWNGYEGLKGALLREQQEKVLKVPGTGMINISDLADDVSNIHPGKKKAVGERLANVVLKEQYEKNELQPYSPKFDHIEIIEDKVVIKFISYGKLTCNGPMIKNFQLAGNDQKFHDATAILKNDKTIELTSTEVNKPVAVRYCFTNDAIPNLFNSTLLPLLPFRTDNW